MFIRYGVVVKPLLLWKTESRRIQLTFSPDLVLFKKEKAASQLISWWLTAQGVAWNCRAWSLAPSSLVLELSSSSSKSSSVPERRNDFKLIQTWNSCLTCPWVRVPSNPQAVSLSLPAFVKTVGPPRGSTQPEGTVCWGYTWDVRGRASV